MDRYEVRIQDRGKGFCCYCQTEIEPVFAVLFCSAIEAGRH